MVADVDIGQHQVKLMLGQALGRLLEVSCSLYPVTDIAQDFGDRLAECLIVLHDQDARERLVSHRSTPRFSVLPGSQDPCSAPGRLARHRSALEAASRQSRLAT